MRPPDYPANAVRAGLTSSVYLIVKTGRDGKVLDVIAEQVNLGAGGSEFALAKWRKVFANVSLQQARTWCLEPPTAGEGADAEFHLSRVPVKFSLGSGPLSYGMWETYVPGPRQPNPWQQDKEGAAFTPDTLAPGRAYVTGSGLKLLTALSGS